MEAQAQVAQPRQIQLLWKDSQYHWLVTGTQCAGCGSNLSSKIVAKTVFDTDPNALVIGGSCGSGGAFFTANGGIGMHGSGAYGVYLANKLRGLDDRTIVNFGGDGSTLEMTIDDLLAGIERNPKVLHVTFDNEVYANSGGALNSQSPVGSYSTIYTQGKEKVGKNAPLMMVFSQAKYVATASPYYIKDLVAKVRRGMEVTPSYIQVISPCQPSWGYDPSKAATLARLAVQTGLFPLWEYDNGVFRRTVPIEKHEPVDEYVRQQRRFRHLDADGIERLQEYADDLERKIDKMEKGFAPD